jgi:hypothetical protein
MMTNSSSHRPETSFSKGMVVDRHIEGLWFEARIIELNERECTAKIKYVDDGNEEGEVSFDDLRLSEGDRDSCSSDYPRKRLGDLQKPLSGLIDDDFDERSKHRPTVTIHHDTETEVIILNGAENKLAAGGGIRALRYLNKVKP